jgi:predicted permease
MLQDLRYALRTLLRNPGFTAVVIATLALGIGANAAFFSVVNGVLLNPLPFPDADQLVTIHQSKQNFETGAIPYLNFVDMQRENRTFSSMAISRGTGFTFSGSGEPERVRARMISADYFNVFGVKPALGRTFVPDDDRRGAELVALISANFWSRKFSSAPDITEKSITLDDRSYRVVGVIPASFSLMSGTDVYVAIGAWNTPALQNRGAALGIHGIGRLKPGVTFDQAQADLSRVMLDLAVAYPATNKENGAKLVPLKGLIVSGVQPILLILLAAVGFVLLIACVNVSNLMLARSSGKTREFAIRSALGAARWRMLRQSLIESTLLSLIGGVAGLIIAAWGTELALKSLPTALPRAEEVRLDARVLLFTLGVSLLTGIFTGLVPALRSSQSSLSETLKEGGRGASSSRGRAQGVLVALEMAMALVLLIGAGLLIRSLNALWKVDPGFRPDNVLTLEVTFPASIANASPNTIRTVLRDLNDRLIATPGVAAVSALSGAAPLINEDDRFFWIDGGPKPTSHSEMHMALFYVVDPGYLPAMGIQLTKGRFFTDQDDERSARVVVIDEMLAHQRFGSENPLGKRINLDDDQGPYEVIGVVGHVKQFGLDSDETQSLQAQLYLPFRGLPDDQVEGTNGVGLVVRSNIGGGEITPSFINSIRQAIQSQNSQNVISNTQTMNEVIAGSLAQRRVSMILLGSFAAVALLLASLGIYGVISYLVGQRTHEIGIRVALGARRSDILRLVLGHGMRMTLAGVAIGILSAFALTRLMTTMLFGVSATDPVTYGIIAVLLTFVALLACYVPARRATKVDPLVALRYE